MIGMGRKKGGGAGGRACGGGVGVPAAGGPFAGFDGGWGAAGRIGIGIVGPPRPIGRIIRGEAPRPMGRGG